MNPICPYCKVPLKTKFRSWVDRRFGTVDGTDRPHEKSNTRTSGKGGKRKCDVKK